MAFLCISSCLNVLSRNWVKPLMLKYQCRNESWICIWQNKKMVEKVLYQILLYVQTSCTNVISMLFDIISLFTGASIIDIWLQQMATGNHSCVGTACRVTLLSEFSTLHDRYTRGIFIWRKPYFNSVSLSTVIRLCIATFYIYYT